MINHYVNIDGIPLYIDKYMEDDRILKGRKGNSDTLYFVANPKQPICFINYIKRNKGNKN